MAKRLRPSQITRHPERLSIELARLRGVPLREVAERFEVDKDAVHRHMAALSPEYRAALQADIPIAELAERAAREGGSVLDNLAILQAGLMQAALSARTANDHQAHGFLARVLLEVLKERGRLTEGLAGAPNITNITNNFAIMMASPLMGQLQRMLERRLAPFPDAYEAVMSGLSDLDGAAAGNTKVLDHAA